MSAFTGPCPSGILVMSTGPCRPRHGYGQVTTQRPLLFPTSLRLRRRFVGDAAPAAPLALHDVADATLSTPLYTCSADADVDADAADADATASASPEVERSAARKPPKLRKAVDVLRTMLDRRSALDLTGVAPRPFARSTSDTYGRGLRETG